MGKVGVVVSREICRNPWDYLIFCQFVECCTNDAGKALVFGVPEKAFVIMSELMAQKVPEMAIDSNGGSSVRNKGRKSNCKHLEKCFNGSLGRLLYLIFNK